MMQLYQICCEDEFIHRINLSTYSENIVVKAIQDSAGEFYRRNECELWNSEYSSTNEEGCIRGFSKLWNLKDSQYTESLFEALLSKVSAKTLTNHLWEIVGICSYFRNTCISKRFIWCALQRLGKSPQSDESWWQ